jgi:hypothetical protein
MGLQKGSLIAKEAGRKAALTRAKKKKEVIIKQKSAHYLNDKKSESREFVLKYLELEERTLLLETHNFEMAKLLPDADIHVWERNKDEYELMQKTKPKNVILHYGSVSEYNHKEMISQMWLDFMGTYEKEREQLLTIINKIKKEEPDALQDIKTIILTLCLRASSKNQLIKEQILRLITQLNIDLPEYKLIDSFEYKNGMTMIVIVLKHWRQVHEFLNKDERILIQYIISCLTSDEQGRSFDKKSRYRIGICGVDKTEILTWVKHCIRGESLIFIRFKDWFDRAKDEDKYRWLDDFLYHLVEYGFPLKYDNNKLYLIEGNVLLDIMV